MDNAERTSIVDSLQETSRQIHKSSSVLLLLFLASIVVFLSPDSYFINTELSVSTPFIGAIPMQMTVVFLAVSIILINIPLYIYYLHWHELEKIRIANSIPAHDIFPLRHPVLKWYTVATIFLLLPISISILAYKSGIYESLSAYLWFLVLSTLFILLLYKLFYKNHIPIKSFFILNFEYSFILSILATTTICNHTFMCNRSLNLELVNLSDSNLAGINLENANLINANLSNSYLKDSNLSKANFKGANLSGAYLSNANISEANFENAVLKNTNFTKTDATSLNFNGADLSNTKIYETNLNNTNFKYSILKDTIFDGIEMMSADFEGANLDGTLFHNTSLENANFSYTTLNSSTIFRNTYLGEAHFNEASIIGVNFAGLDFYEALFIKTYLYNINFTCSNLTRASMPGAKLRYANLERTCFEEANLENADFFNADFDNTMLSGANLLNARNLTQTQLGNACGDKNTKLDEPLTIRNCDYSTRCDLHECKRHYSIND